MQVMDKRNLIIAFPKLIDDEVFQSCRMSPEDDNYNCIAWAYMLFENRWMWPPGGEPHLDGVTYWPDGVGKTAAIENLVDAFKNLGYEVCDQNWQHEGGFIKVALYYNPHTNEFTHAARESRTGTHWLSKLGRSHDICHKNPYTIENDIYGKVYCIMKRSEK